LKLEKIVPDYFLPIKVAIVMPWRITNNILKYCNIILKEGKANGEYRSKKRRLKFHIGTFWALYERRFHAQEGPENVAGKWSDMIESGDRPAIGVNPPS